MHKNENISGELAKISKHIAGLDINHPFTVPDGYFDRFPSQVMVRIAGLHGKEDTNLPDVAQVSNPIQVPENYFENLADQVLERIKNQSPENELSILSPVLAGLEKRNPFKTPEGYFDEMPSNITAGIQAVDFVQSELEILPSSLTGIKGKNVFKVPDGYFEQLPDEVMKKIRPEVPVLKMNFRRKMMQYAAAAAFISILVVTAWLFNRSPDNQATNIAAINLDSSLNQLTDRELSNYVETNLNVVLPDPAVNPAANDLDPEDMKVMLADISDSDLEQYLEKYGIISDNHTN